MSLVPGSRLAAYEIVALLGSGGMGEVYRARDLRLHRDVALKIIRGTNEDESRRRMLREARAAAAVSHPNICQVFEAGEEQGALFITMELLTGETLADRISRGRIPVSEAISLAVETLTALHVIHAQGFIHRDLKPENIFLTPHGIKILDFGLARPASVDAGPSLTQTASRLTQVGMTIGTPRYMAPEQIHGLPLDAQTDLFAMGATLYEMLSGRPAFAGSTSVDILHATLHDTPAALGGSRTIESVNRIVQRLIAKNREDRPASASAAAEELRSCLVLGDMDRVAEPRTMSWLIVLPFRVLRADAETDFLGLVCPTRLQAHFPGSAL
jgi:serine/threonine protein kinase